MEHKIVDYADDPVECPKCGQELRKGRGWKWPTIPQSSITKNAQNATSTLGSAYCDNPECSLSDDLISWSYRLHGQRMKDSEE